MYNPHKNVFFFTAELWITEFVLASFAFNCFQLWLICAAKKFQLLPENFNLLPKIFNLLPQKINLLPKKIESSDEKNNNWICSKPVNFSYAVDSDISFIAHWRPWDQDYFFSKNRVLVWALVCLVFVLLTLEVTTAETYCLHRDICINAFMYYYDCHDTRTFLDSYA